MSTIDEVEVLIDLDPDAEIEGKLRARVMQWVNDEPVYGANLLQGRRTVRRLNEAKQTVTGKLGDRVRTITFVVDPGAWPKEASLNDKAVATPRDNYGYRSSGR